MSSEINDNIIDPIEIQRMKKALIKTTNKRKLLNKLEELQKIYSVSQISRLSGVRAGTLRTLIYGNTEKVGTYNYVLISKLYTCTANMLKTMKKSREAIAKVTGKRNVIKG